uniref:PPR_long domain-containing protein n=1 Tax=Panagrellus redivivus TaxID=6233 RepID=A0A7E4UN13_PANRE
MLRHYGNRFALLITPRASAISFRGHASKIPKFKLHKKRQSPLEKAAFKYEPRKHHVSQAAVVSEPTVSQTSSGCILTAEDEQLISRGDFYGVRTSTHTQLNIIPPEQVISKLKQMIDNNLRFNAEFFLINVLLPLEQNRNDWPKFLKQIAETRKASKSVSPDVYLPFLIRCCGVEMSDISEASRLKILERLLKVVESHGIPMSVDAWNAVLNVYLQNDHVFDVDDVLRKIEIEEGLTPNVDLFNLLMWGLAVQGKNEQIAPLLHEMSKRNLTPNFDSELPQIFSAAFCGFDAKAESLIARSVARHGESVRSDCLGVQIRGAATARNIDRVRSLLRSSVLYFDKGPANFGYASDYRAKPRYVVNLHHDVIFDVIWQLAKKSHFRDGHEFAALTEQILEHAQRQAGFFKMLFRETIRHIVHDYYFSATVLISDTLRVQDMLKSQMKNTYVMHIFPRLCRQMIRSGVDKDVIWDVSNRLISTFGAEKRFYDHLLFAVLTFKNYRYDERFDNFAKFVELIDPERVRPHLILPILARCPDMLARKKILYQCITLGYTDISLLDNNLLIRYFYAPMLEELSTQYMTDFERLSEVSKNLETFHVPRTQTFNVLFNWAKRVDNPTVKPTPPELPLTRANFKEWIQAEYDELFTGKAVEAAEIHAKYNIDLFKRRLAARDVEKVHTFLVKRGSFPPEVNFDEVLEPLLNLYLADANAGYLKKMLTMLAAVGSTDEKSQVLRDFDLESSGHADSSGGSPVKNYHILKLLTRHFEDHKDIRALIEYVYELKRLFPDAVAANETWFDSIKAYERLFRSILTPTDGQVSVELVNGAIDLVTLLVRFDLMMLHGNELLTVTVVETVLQNLGWDAAVDTWLKFQSSLYCPNSLFALMKHNIDDKTRIQYLIHRAQNFISAGRVNAYLAAAYVFRGDVEAANEIVKAKNPPFRSSDYLTALRLLQVQKNYQHALKFSELLLRYTDLRVDDHAKHLVTSYWVNHLSSRKVASMALDFYELFKSYDVYPTLEQMHKIRSVCDVQKALIEKWTLNPETRVLNTPVKPPSSDDFLTRYASFTEDLQRFEATGKPYEARENVIPATDDAADTTSAQTVN